MLKTLVIGLIKEKKMKIHMPEYRVEKMPAISGWKLCRLFRVGRYRQFRVGKYAGDVGSEDMPAISGRKICWRFRVEKKCRQCRIVTKCRQVRAGKKMPVFSGGDKMAGKPAIAGELTLTGLIHLSLLSLN